MYIYISVCVCVCVFAYTRVFLKDTLHSTVKHGGPVQCKPALLSFISSSYCLRIWDTTLGKGKRGKEGSRRARARQSTSVSLEVRRGYSLLAKSEIVYRTYLYHSCYYMLCQTSDEDLKPRLHQLHTGTTARCTRADITIWHPCPRWRSHQDDS